MVRAPYVTAVRLTAIAADHWVAIDGESAGRGVELITLPFDRFLNAIQWWAMQRVKDLERFLADLERPAGGGVVVTDRELEQDAASFMAFASAFGVKPPKANPERQVS